MTTLAVYCKNMGWDVNDPRIKDVVGNISADTELRADQMDALQEAMYTALGAVKPGDDPMLDAFNGRRLPNGNLQFNSNQDMSDYLNATMPKNNSPTFIRNELARRWEKAEGFTESTVVVLDMVANIGAYMPWNWNK